MTWNRTKWLLGQCLKKMPGFSGCLEYGRCAGIHCCQPSKTGYFLPKLAMAYLVQPLPPFLWVGCNFVPNVIKTGLTTIYKACSCSQHTTSGLTTSQERLQADILGGVQDALWHPAWLVCRFQPSGYASLIYNIHNIHIDKMPACHTSSQHALTVIKINQIMCEAKECWIPDTATNWMFILSL